MHRSTIAAGVKSHGAAVASATVEDVGGASGLQLGFPCCCRWEERPAAAAEVSPDTAKAPALHGRNNFPKAQIQFRSLQGS
jgi:hypothetical protein